MMINVNRAACVVDLQTWLAYQKHNADLACDGKNDVALWFVVMPVCCLAMQHKSHDHMANRGIFEPPISEELDQNAASYHQLFNVDEIYSLNLQWFQRIPYACDRLFGYRFLNRIMKLLRFYAEG